LLTYADVVEEVHPSASVMLTAYCPTPSPVTDEVVAPVTHDTNREPFRPLVTVTVAVPVAPPQMICSEEARTIEAGSVMLTAMTRTSDIIGNGHMYNPLESRLRCRGLVHLHRSTNIDKAPGRLKR